MKIMVFTHGTIVMQGEGGGVSREERVRQSLERRPTVFDLDHYAAIGQAVSKLWSWQRQGAELCYLGPSRKPENMIKNEQILRRLSFPPGTLYHREPTETYAQVVERVSPGVLIEDDCESIGGEAEMATPHLSTEARARITTIVVPELGGLDHLPDDPARLISWNKPGEGEL
jgi:hypothetical protein